MYLEFIESLAFTRYLQKYLADDDYRQLQIELAANPEAGDLMPGTWWVSQDALGGCAARQGTQRWIAGDLLLLRIRSADLVDDDLQQR